MAVTIPTPIGSLFNREHCYSCDMEKFPSEPEKSEMGGNGAVLEENLDEIAAKNTVPEAPQPPQEAREKLQEMKSKASAEQASSESSRKEPAQNTEIDSETTKKLETAHHHGETGFQKIYRPVRGVFGLFLSWFFDGLKKTMGTSGEGHGGGAKAAGGGMKKSGGSHGGGGHGGGHH